MNRLILLLLLVTLHVSPFTALAADPPNYNASTVTGESWQRVYSVHIDNPSDGLPSINFVEQRVTLLSDGRKLYEHVGSLTNTYDPTNPRHPQLFGLLNAEYEALRAVRDTPKPVMSDE